jgi:hypothetical protein
MRRVITCSLAALTLVLSGGSALATTLYRWVDAQGVVHYSDTPQPGAQKMEIQGAQTYKAPPAPRSTASATAAQSAGASDGSGSSSYQCAIATPGPEQSFSNPDTVEVDVSVAPALSGGDRLQVTVDGAALPVSPSGQGLVQSPERGTHIVNLTVQSADGKTACSASVSFNVQRASLLSPQSPAHH